MFLPGAVRWGFVRSAGAIAGGVIPETKCSGMRSPGAVSVQPDNSNHRLSLIPTLWSLVCQAHHGPAEAVNTARQQLLERYGNAVHRYLRKVLRNEDAADEVFQDFVLNLLHGDLRGANPKRGRFRNFVKGTLFHLVADYQKQRRKWPGPLPEDDAELAVNPDE